MSNQTCVPAKVRETLSAPCWQLSTAHLEECYFESSHHPTRAAAVAHRAEMFAGSDIDAESVQICEVPYVCVWAWDNWEEQYYHASPTAPDNASIMAEDKA